MKKIFLLIILMPFLGFSQIRLIGTVLNENGMPIENADVFLFTNKLILLEKKQTNQQGQFIFEQSEGTYDIEIRYPQVNLFKKEVVLDSNIDLGNVTMHNLQSNENIKQSESEKEKTYNVVFNSSYNQQRAFPSFTNDLSIVHNYKKWTVNSNVTYSDEKNFWENDRKTYYTDLTFIGTKKSEYSFKNFSSYFDIQFRPTEKTTFDIYAINNKYSNQLNVGDNINIYENPNSLSRTHIGDKKSLSDSQRNAINFLFKHEFKNKKTITFEADWAQKKGYYKQDTNGQDYDETNTPIEDKSFITFNDGRYDMDVYSVNGLISIPSRFFDMNLGLKWVFAELDFETNFFRKYQTGYVRDEALSPISKYIESRPLIFTNFKKALKKWSFELGGKLENTSIKGYVFDTLDKPIQNNYYNFLPSINVKYDLNESDNINFRYEKTLSRPLFRYINPGIGIYNAYENYTGSPKLQPSILDDLSISYSFKSKYNISFLYSRVNDGIGGLATFTSDNVIAHKLLNYLDLSTYQITTTAKLKSFDFMETDFQLDGFHKSNSFSIPVINSRNLWGWYGAINNQVYFNKSKTISNTINFWYKSRTIEDEFLFKSRYILNLGLKLTFLNNNLVININANDVLQSLNEYAESTVSSINQQFRNYWNPRTFGVSVLYKFGSNKLSYERRYAENDSDHNR